MRLFGDNGIISNAQNAIILNSCAVLSEFLNETYIDKNMDNLMNGDMTALEVLLNTDAINFFQFSENNSPYFLEPTTYKKYYFINKSNLPEEIKSVIKGGDTINSGIYTSFTDVYGVTSDLKVFYCQNGIDSGVVNNLQDCGEENLNKVVLSVSRDYDFVNLLGYSEDCTLSNLRSIQEIDINKNGLDLSKLMYFSNLKKITFSNVSYDNLDGIQYSPYLYYVNFKNTTIGDYSQLAKVAKLQYLYLWKSSDSEIVKLCDNTIGIGQKEIPTLKYFSISDTLDERSINSNWWERDGDKEGVSNVTNIGPLRNLSSVTQQAIRYLTVEKTEVEDLKPLSGFTGVTLLVIDNNQIKNLDGIENMKNLNSLTCYSNPLGLGVEVDTYDSSIDSLKALLGLDKLSYIRMRNCPNLVYIDSLKNNSSITTLDLRKCYSLNDLSVANVRNQIIAGGTLIDTKYQYALADKELTTSLDLSNQDVTIAQLNTIGEFKKIKTLKLNNVKINGSVDGTNETEAVETLNRTLLKLNNLNDLQLINFKGFNDCSKLINVANEAVLDLRGTSVNTNFDTTGIQVLNNKTIGGLIVDGSNIDAVKIQPILNQFYYRDDFEKPKAWKGFICLNSNSLQTLENCTSLNRLVSIGQGYDYKLDAELDLSNLTNLKTIIFNHTYLTKIKCPKNLESLISMTMGSTAFDISNCDSLKNVYLDAYSNSELLISTIKGKSSIEKLELNGKSVIEKIFVPNIDTFSTLSGLKELYFKSSHWNSNRIDITSLGDWTSLGGLQNLNKIYIEHVAVLDKDFSTISNLSKLTDLTIKDSNVEDISFIMEMTDLTTVDLSKNTINSGFNDISNLVNLKSLNLSYNSIQDIETVNGTNINIIDKLLSIHNSNSGMSLEYLYLSDNFGISNDGKVKLSSKTWSDKSGF